VAKVEIRRMREVDLDEVLEIERDLFSLPWSRTSFLFEMSDSTTSYAISVGYAVAWFVADELHIGNVAVVRSRQGGGIGRSLVGHLIKEALKREVRYATLEVRVGNVRAIKLYRGYGFRGIAIRKRYYANDGEDALVMLAEVGQGRPGEPGDWVGNDDGEAGGR
jgi:ribosomal-protein-alanine N-acetyltransferase